MKNKSKFFVAATSAVVAISSVGVAEGVLATTPEEDVKNVLATKELTLSAAEATSPTSRISKLVSFYSNAYNEQFRVSPTDITNISTNGGSYSGTTPEHLLDDNTNTHWVSNTDNSETFKNHLIFTLKETTKLDRILFTPRIKGMMTSEFYGEFEIHASTSDSGDDFSLVATGKMDAKITDKIEIGFEPTDFKRVKFVFKEANFDVASASEIMFYKEDSVESTIRSIFTDKTMSKVTPAYASWNTLLALEKTIEGHPKYDVFKADIDYAKKLVSGEMNTAGTLVTAEQVGDRRAYALNTLRTEAGSNFQPTGFAALAGQTINVYVEAGGSDKLPTLTFTQHEGSWSSWKKTVSLKEGKNVLTVPTIPTDGAYVKTVTKGGPIYISNPYTADEQNGAPIVRIEGAQKIPLMTKDKTVAEFKAEVQAHAVKVDRDKIANPNIANRKVIDVAELMSDHVLATISNTSAYRAFGISGRNPQEILNGYDLWMEKMFAFHGLDGSNDKHDPTLIRENIRLMQQLGYMYAYYDHTGINGTQDMFLTYNMDKVSPGWGLNHEIGHRLENPWREFRETTNNMTAMHMSVLYNQTDTRIPYDSLYKNVISENKVNHSSQGLFAQLGAYWQVELAYPGYWSKMERLFREKKIVTNSDAEKQQQIVRISSEAVGKDLSSHFARHGFSVNQETRNLTKQYEKPANIWYLNNSVIGYKGNGFPDTATLEANIVKNDTQNTVNFTISEADQAELLGYEIVRDGQVIAFTRSTSFVDTNTDTSVEHEYTVVAYDKKLKTISKTAE